METRPRETGEERLCLRAVMRPCAGGPQGERFGPDPRVAGSPPVCGDTAGGGGIWRGAPGTGARASPGWGCLLPGRPSGARWLPGAAPQPTRLRLLPLPWQSAAILSSCHYLISGFSHGAPGGWEKGPWGFIPSSRYPSRKSPRRYATFKHSASGGSLYARLCARPFLRREVAEKPGRRSHLGGSRPVPCFCDRFFLPIRKV